MTLHKRGVDKPFMIVAIMLMVSGFIIFNSASLGLLAKETSNYSSVAFSQTVLGFILGTIAMIVAAKLDFRLWKKWAFWVLLLAIILNILVLIPSIGFEHGGARRWLSLGPISFQPAEILKLAFILYFAAWAVSVREKIKSFSLGFVPLVTLLSICAILLLLQPDTDNLMLIVITALAMFIAAGGEWKYVASLVLAGILGVAILAFMRPYVMQRVITFLNPQNDALGAGYQIQQSLIAIGSGGLFGNGFGQSVQKFTYLPEPVGDSIFAVLGEEFGFVGSVGLIIIFVFFATRGLKISSRTTDGFGRLVVVGIVIMIVSQAFVNIGAMLGVLPLLGITLPFVSHGGTSLFITLLEVGLVLSISRSQKS